METATPVAQEANIQGAPTPHAPTDTSASLPNSPASETADTATTGLAPTEQPAADAVTGLPVPDSLNGVEPLTLLDQLQQFLSVGGPVVWILLGFSVIALSILLLKIWQFTLLRPESSPRLEHSLKLWRASRCDEALETIKGQGPINEVVSLAMTGLQNGGDSPRLRDELERVATLRLNQLRAFLRPLEVIAMLSPLLGLLGTVLGMIGAFQQMEAAGNQVDPSVLSGGIWQALLTTAVGIAVAIPVTLAHSWLERKTERVAALMSDTVTRVFTSAPPLKTAQENTENLRHAA
ncbi:MotA/TolQ/ExbB proton channel family protein [Marinobacterium rhizophilum]|uniref:MotA/TolQ/ExbB proton channel family protein n=1 Tax=Marinobacterium rhizophilum TaxID=420402 RepID=A0ABY5HCK0_9GAMM|nr:MotA/TolQ/ExbB proton channel family protein [Marinobacterium rhizophilum]UTW10077.1 MotA/TolQ/ExbB proton channel family protein [Marinobacterium rhizophilum]